ncbi:MAG: GGDEF domain-containing protein [Burkholderiaceae bacterium]
MNFAALTDRLSRPRYVAGRSLANTERTGESFSLLAMDLDNIKLVNDLHGHTAGADLIRTVANRISSKLHQGDVIVRLSGDEFAILAPSIVEPSEAMSLAERLLEIWKESVRLNNVEVMINASIGIALFPADGDTIEDLQRDGLVDFVSDALIATGLPGDRHDASQNHCPISQGASDH